ncbi:MAG: hypothetical protein WBN08_00145 [Thiogranum sp.]
MSRKTKTDLEKRYKALGVMYRALERKTGQLEVENSELKSLVAELERDSRSLREMRDMVLEGAEWVQYKLRITDEALDKTIQDSSDHINSRDNIVEGCKRGPIEKSKSEENKKHLVERYNHWLTEGKRPETARKKANEDVKTRYGKGYEKHSLYKHCPEPGNGNN